MSLIIYIRINYTNMCFRILFVEYCALCFRWIAPGSKYLRSLKNNISGISIYEDLELRHLRAIIRNEIKTTAICSQHIARNCPIYCKIVCKVNRIRHYSISEHRIINLQLFILHDNNDILKVEFSNTSRYICVSNEFCRAHFAAVIAHCNISSPDSNQN
jgi:hypothetical protein